MAVKKHDFLIIGGGMVGLSVAYQLLKREAGAKILIVEKEKELGLHSSGRNSGVLHAGLYYEPDSLKANVCVSGAKRLKHWVIERKLPINHCGKVIVPQKIDLDCQLDVLLRRGKANGAKVELIDNSQLKELLPEAYSKSGRAIWSPDTAVVNPKSIIKQIKEELVELGVDFLFNAQNIDINQARKTININSTSIIAYGHLINCAGLNADLVAKKCDVGKNYRLIPFKGIYWQIKKSSPIQPKRNLYPVPDLNMPFLGVHFTPNTDINPITNIGPTATFAWGRENYRNLSKIEPSSSLYNLALLSQQYLTNKGGIRKYVHEQAFLAYKKFFISAAKDLIPELTDQDIELSKKVGIRSQLFNEETKNLENDFLCVHRKDSTHILNAISPAFTASFSFADLIVDRIISSKNDST